MVNTDRLRLGEPLVAETLPSRKAILLLPFSLLSGLGCGVLVWRQTGDRRAAHLELPATSPLAYPAQSVKVRQPMFRHSIQPLRAEAAVEPVAASTGDPSLQEALKKIAQQRDKSPKTIAQFPVKALRRITSQGADVAEGTMGTIENGLIRWDGGAFSEDQTFKCIRKYRSRDEIKDQCVGLGVEYKVMKIPEDATKPLKKEVVRKIRERTDGLVRELAGITEPMGLFDPWGLSTTIPDGKLLFYREVELKHGRIGMLASLGFLVGERYHPLFGGNIDNPAYTAFQETPLQTFWPAVVAAIAIPEIYSVFSFEKPADGPWMIKKGRIPGDLNFDPLGIKPTKPEEFKEMQAKEINNGRLAMLAAAGMIAQELATGKKLF